MFDRNFIGLVAILILCGTPMAQAGKIELTTYYPAPDGKYQELKAVHRLKVPVKPVGVTSSTVGLIPGEIWFEGNPCPTGKAWNNGTSQCE